MVFKPFTHLARQSLAKTFTHGYAQSVVAATQSSYASSTTPLGPFGNHAASRFSKSGTPHLHNAFQNTSISSEARPKTAQTSLNEPSAGDGGLADYYAAWQKHQHCGEEHEWKQFQFTKRIGWRGPSIVPDGKLKEEDVLKPEGLLGRAGLERAYSTSAVDDIKKAENVVADVVAVAEIDKSTAQEVSGIQQVSAATDEQVATSAGPNDVLENAPLQSEVSATISSTASSDVATSPLDSRSPSSDETAATSTQDVDTQPFEDQISYLRNANRFAEIPAVFESMLVQSVRPTAYAYDALLAAAINLPSTGSQLVSKALNIYSDMLRRNVLPITATYATLIELLSTRALDVVRMKSEMNGKRLRFGGMKEAGRFMFRSNEAEYSILAEDDALANAVRLFKLSLQPGREYSANTYRLLISACATYGEVDHMIRVYSHMEANKVKPHAAIFAPMIEAFAVSGDLSSAVECYNEYKSLAIADDSGKFSVIQRTDNEVYAAVVKAYAVCDKSIGGKKFFGKIVDSFENTDNVTKDRLESVRNTVIFDGFVQESLKRRAFSDAFDYASQSLLSSFLREKAMSQICIAAADGNNVEIATKAYENGFSDVERTPTAAMAMLALHIRQGDLDMARTYWSALSAWTQPDNRLIEPTTMYSVALIGSGLVDEGLMQARQSFARVRTSASNIKGQSDSTDEIDEAIEFIGSFLAEHGVVPSPNASVSFLWAMIENRGLVSPVAEQMLAGLGPAEITKLSWQDLILALQVEADLICSGQSVLDIDHPSRFAYLLEAVTSIGTPLEQRTVELVEKSLERIAHQRPGLVTKWQAYRQAMTSRGHQSLTYTPRVNPVIDSPPVYSDTFDPYSGTTDYKGSAVIAEELERHDAKTSTGLNEALLRFKNIRRAGRHPRYIVYAKLIAAAGKDGRANLVHDILGMARQDVPFMPNYRVVQHGWASILDAMVGACLTLGNRTLAAEFHQELLGMGAAPTANTFGLYITTLKESTKTFDEATEAVKIFHRAKSEGVEPSSFLYNALIGKLGKARRIDDCLFYFAEMRSLGIRPTSVTYGTVVNALCRVSDERFAEELFEEMESMPNYKPRPAPYNSLMQFFLTTKRDSSKVLAYHERMRSRNIRPTMHTYKLLIDTYATLEPINMAAAEDILQTMRTSGDRPEAVHYASLIHAKGCVLHDLAGARETFDFVLQNAEVRPQACLYQALFESMVANHSVKDTEGILQDMSTRRIEMTPYIANTLIHGWATEKDITKSKSIYNAVGKEKREPSTYEAMTRAFLSIEDRPSASEVVHEMLSRGYPSAVSGKILELLGH
ncbi:hypothetical protein MMC20_006515 [Loxospora ochrophaea]|nr:hypothetical protein [Loxospora ochrophaea]